MASVVQRLWCVGNQILPLQRKVLDLVVITSDGRLESVLDDTEFLLLPLKVSQGSKWLDEYLEKPPKWWWFNGHHQPLIQELLKAIPGTGGTLSKRAGLSKRNLVKIVVRGREVVVMNNRKAVTLAFNATTFDGQDLQWILEALKEDLTHSQGDLEGTEGTGGPRKMQVLETTSEAGWPDRKHQREPQGPRGQVCLVPSERAL